MPYKTIGIIGGMGPLATVDFEKKPLTVWAVLRSRWYSNVPVCRW